MTKKSNRAADSRKPAKGAPKNGTLSRTISKSAPTNTASTSDAPTPITTGSAPEPKGDTPGAATSSPESPANSPAPVAPSPASSAPVDVQQALFALDQPTQPGQPAGAGGNADAGGGTPGDGGIAPSAESREPVKRKGGWQKGRPRGPKKATTGGPDHSILNFPQRATVQTPSPELEAEIAKLRDENNTLRAMHDPNIEMGVRGGFALIARLGFAMAARRKGTHWYLAPEEEANIADAATEAARPFFKYVAAALPFIAVAGALYASVSVRLDMEVAIDKGQRPRLMPEGFEYNPPKPAAKATGA